MKLRNSANRYGALSIGMHWGMAILIVAVFATMELHEFFPKGSAERAALKTWHFMLGLSVLALVLVRLVLRLTDTVPPITPAPVRWQEQLAKLMHFALYVFMIAMPLAGWLILSAKGKPIPFYGVQLPALIGQNRDAAGWIKEIHEAGAAAGYFLIGGHALAGLFHHYVVKDNTLRRILPARD